MINRYTMEGEIINSRGSTSAGSRLSVVRKIDVSCFKEELVVVGKNGFRGYPSVELYIAFTEWLENSYNIEGEILEIKKEGTYNAFFRAYK